MLLLQWDIISDKLACVCWFVQTLSPLLRYEDLRYWYDCLCYDEELRKYDEYVAALHEQENQYASAAQEVSSPALNPDHARIVR